MVIGNEDAPVTIIEYASLTCGHCANFHKNTLPELKKQYIDTGKAKMIMREFPLDPVASGGFMLARCAPKDKYFDVLSAMFADQRSWAFTQDPYNSMLNFSKQLGFTQESFEACLGNQQLLDGITAVQERASKEFGVNSTPTFFVNGERIVGASSFDEFSKVIEVSLSSGQNSASTPPQPACGGVFMPFSRYSRNWRSDSGVQRRLSSTRWPLVSRSLRQGHGWGAMSLCCPALSRRHLSGAHARDRNARQGNGFCLPGRLAGGGVLPWR
ncbi:DsbA family protein [Pannonibacter sp. Pt2-lr]